MIAAFACALRPPSAGAAGAAAAAGVLAGARREGGRQLHASAGACAARQQGGRGGRTAAPLVMPDCGSRRVMRCFLRIERRTPGAVATLAWRGAG